MFTLTNAREARIYCEIYFFPCSCLSFAWGFHLGSHWNCVGFALDISNNVKNIPPWRWVCIGVASLVQPCRNINLLWNIVNDPNANPTQSQRKPNMTLTQLEELSGTQVIV